MVSPPELIQLGDELFTKNDRAGDQLWKIGNVEWKNSEVLRGDFVSIGLDKKRDLLKCEKRDSQWNEDRFEMGLMA